MDLIAQLTDQLGLESSQSQALAGGVLSYVKGLASDRLGAEATNHFETAIPELGDWQGRAAELANSEEGAFAGGLGGLLGTAASALGGGGELAALAPLVAKLGIDPQQLTAVAPLVMSFLRSRLDENFVAQLAELAPFLTGQGESGGGVGGMISGFLDG